MNNVVALVVVLGLAGCHGLKLRPRKHHGQQRRARTVCASRVAAESKENSMKRLVLAVVILLPAGVFAADGKATFDKMCASCHGADGKGNPDKAKVLKIDAALLNLGRPETKDTSRDVY